MKVTKHAVFIKQVMKSKKLTQKYVAEKISFNAANFSEFLRGKRTMPMVKVEQVMDLLNIGLVEKNDVF